MASRPTALLSALLLCAYGFPSAWCECNNATQLSVQVDTLLAEYDREAPPSARVSVQLALDVRHATIDQQQSVMRLLADLKMTWPDPRIRWNATEWGCDSALTAAERLWLPDVVVLNEAASSAGDRGLRARLDAAGAVTWISRLDVSVPVALDLRDWPRDTQECTFKFGSRAYNSDELVLVINELKSKLVFESGSWEIQAARGSSSVAARGADSASVAAWAVRVSRRAPALALGAGAALLAAALLLLAAAALPPHQRHPLAACASLISTLWLCSSLTRLPGGGACPRALALQCAACACGALCCACAALVTRVTRLTVPPPRALRTLLSSLSTVCKLTPSAESCSPECGAWAAAGALLDRALRAALLLTLLVLVAVQLF